MAKVTFENVDVHFPVYGSTSKSMKLSVINAIGRGKLTTDGSGTQIVKALTNVSFDISNGDRIALLGSNGAGKTTLLRTIIGAYHPTHGNMTVSGSVVSLLDIGLGISGDLTGFENIKVRGLLLGLSSAAIDEKMEDIAEFSELGDFLNLPVKTYSSGMNLRLAFSIATVIRAQVLVMDEWLSVGDDKFLRKANARLQEIVHDSEIMVLATHSRQTAEANCNRAIVLENGEIKMDGEMTAVANYYWSQ